MAAHITPENISPINYNQIPVITTDLLAKLYGTETVRLRQAFFRNKSRFVEGKHYFMARGKGLEDLKVSLRHSQDLKASLRPFQEIAPNVRKLLLWTERGAARHAKILETDQAWEVFEKLEDCYFDRQTFAPIQQSLPLQLNANLYVEIRDGITTKVRIASEDEAFATFEEFKSMAEMGGFLVIHRDDLSAMKVSEFLNLGEKNLRKRGS